MIYALSDFHSTIRRPHLEAALALWKRAQDSVKYLFGDRTGDPVADRILVSLRQGELTGTEMSHLFDRHVKAERIASALDSLKKAGLVVSVEVATAGRPTTSWRAT
jgi:hypothetical protein